MESKVSANTHLSDLRKQLELVRSNPYTYLNVVKPYLRFNEEKDPDKHLPYALAALQELLAQKVLYKDDKDALYIYTQHNLLNNRRYTGLICTVPVEDYYNGKIKIHEKTITEKEEQLIRHIKATGVIGEPVLLTHREDSELSAFLSQTATSTESIIDFTDENGCSHSISRINSPELIAGFASRYASVGELYIADGHHRSAASAGYFKGNKHLNGHYLACIVPPEFLHIDSFHRAYKSDEPLQVNLFLKSLQEWFEVQPLSSALQNPGKYEFGLLLGNAWYKLTFRPATPAANAVEGLDVSILEEYVFKRILNINDSKTDKRLSFLKGSVPCSELENEVNAGIYDLVFTLHPCTIEQVFEVADQELIMPPKSTYIEPKLLTGLCIQTVAD